MRVLLGLAALAAVNAQTITLSGNTQQDYATAPPVGQTALSQITVRQQSSNGALADATPAIPQGVYINSLNWIIRVPNAVTAVSFSFLTNVYTAQVQHRWSPNYLPAPSSFSSTLSTASYTCDSCATVSGAASPITCNTATGPGTGGTFSSPAIGFRCANLSRGYLFSNLSPSTLAGEVANSFSVQLFDLQTNPAPNVSSYSFVVVRARVTVIVGDPQIVGMQGQDFQVHGMPDEIFNIVSYPTVQINARFTYLESAECHDNFTACFAHPGTYISEEGFRIGKDKVRVTAGSFKKGLTVQVNGKKISSNVDLKHGAVEIVNHRRVVVHTNIMKVIVSNSDKFMNQELELSDDKLVALGSSRTVLKDNERFHPEVPLHGLQGQTWRNVEYASGLEYEGSIMDYHVVDGNLFGTDFVFNQFQN